MHKGEVFMLEVLKVLQDRISSDEVRALLSVEDLRKVTKTISMEQMKTKRYVGEKADFKMPNLANATPEGVIDMLGEVREQMKGLEKLEGIYKEWLKAWLREEETKLKAATTEGVP